MAFQNTPLKTIQVAISTVIGIESEPWYNPANFPANPLQPYPTPEVRDFRWRINLDILQQQHSSYSTRDPGNYNGQDIAVGMWIANTNTGQAWQILTVESKTTTSVTAVVQDVYRYNTFRDSSQIGMGGPIPGIYIVFNIGDTGLPQLDPIPQAGISATFDANIQGRFEYINLQYDYPLYQQGNTFVVGDTIAASSITNSFVLSDVSNRKVIGRVTSVSDVLPGWFTINPVQKIVDSLDYLPGNVGDIIYSSLTVPGGITTAAGGSELYIKLRNNTSSVTESATSGPTTPGNIFQLNGANISVVAPAGITEVVNACNLLTPITGVVASTTLAQTLVSTNTLLISPTYGEPILSLLGPAATATINGVAVTFNIASTDPGYTSYARATQMAEVINAASIPNIVASVPTPLVLTLTNTAGGNINIVNGVADSNGVFFAGTNSGSGLVLTTSSSVQYRLKFTAVDARAINFIDVVGTTIDDFGLISVENGIKASGLYISEGQKNTSLTNQATVPLNANGTTPIGPPIPIGSVILSVLVSVTIADPGALLSVGSVADGVAALMQTYENDPQTIGKYIAETFFTMSASGQINATVTSSSGVGAGSCVVIFEYQVPQ